MVRMATAAGLVLAGGCSAPSAGPALPTDVGSSPGSGTVVWFAGPTTTPSDDVRQVLVDAFEQAYPSIRVQLITGPNSTDRLRSMLVNKLYTAPATPDVYSGDVIWPYEFAHDRLALPLSKYLPASFWARFEPPRTPPSGDNLVRAMSYRGSIYAVPYFIDEGFLYYRKDLLARAGLRPPATWEQLVQDAKVLRAKGLPYQFVWQGDDYEGLTCDWTEILADASGGLPADANPAAELASPQALKALVFLRSLILDGISPRHIDTFQEHDADNAFDSGKAAFLRGWDSSYAAAMSSGSVIADPRKVGVMPPPTFQGQRGPGWSVIGGWNLFVNPHTRNLRADLTFITWMAGTQAQRIIASQFSEIPSNASVRDDSAVTAVNPVLRAAAGTRLVSRPSATIIYQAITDAIHSNIHAALPGPSSDGLNPCQALIRAAREIDPHVHGTLRCAGSATGQG